MSMFLTEFCVVSKMIVVVVVNFLMHKGLILCNRLRLIYCSILRYVYITSSYSKLGCIVNGIES